MSRLEAAMKAHLEAPRTRGMDTGGPMRAALTAADAHDADNELYRIGLDKASVARTAERSWDLLAKRDRGRTWSQVGQRSQALWMENVQNVLEAAVTTVKDTP